jgi:hypothetical protein
MRPTRFVVSLLIVLLASGVVRSAHHQETVQERERRVGRIIIEGNTITPDWIISRQFDLYPGQLIQSADLTRARLNLDRVNLFQLKRITILNPDPDVEFKDILIEVTENPNARVGAGFYWLYQIEQFVRGTSLEEPLRGAEEKRGTHALIDLLFFLFETSLDAVGVAWTAAFG